MIHGDVITQEFFGFALGNLFITLLAKPGEKIGVSKYLMNDT
jgi:hypothetical protein